MAPDPGKPTAPISFHTIPIPEEIRGLHANVESLQLDLKLIQAGRHPDLQEAAARVQAQGAALAERTATLSQAYGKHPFLNRLQAFFEEEAALEADVESILAGIQADPREVSVDLLETARGEARSRRVLAANERQFQAEQAELKEQAQYQLDEQRLRLTMAEQADLVNCLEQYYAEAGVTAFDLASFDGMEPALRARHGWDGGRLQTLAKQVLERNEESSRPFYSFSTVAAFIACGIILFLTAVQAVGTNANTTFTAISSAMDRQAAESEAASRHYARAQKYYLGDGLKQDFVKAVRWYRKAAARNHPAAEYKLGLCYVCGEGVQRDDVEAVRWIRKAANQNVAEAQAYLCLCYDKGQGVPQDYAKAADWYRQAADQEDSDAQFALGLKYYLGQGVPQDQAEAVKWYRKAAAQGDAWAQNNLV